MFSAEPAFIASTPLPKSLLTRHARCARTITRAMAAPEEPNKASLIPNLPTSPLPSTHASPGVPIEDDQIALACIWLLRTALRSRSGLTSHLVGYPGLVEECRMLLRRKSAAEQRGIVAALLHAAVFPPIGVAMFRKFFAHRPAFNADLTPLCFSWLVGESERNKPEEGGEGVFIKKCRFLEEASCKGLCVNMCQQPVQDLFTNTLGLPLRMTPNYDDNSCQMTFGIAPLPVDKDPAASGDCLDNCKMSKAFRKTHSTARKSCYVEKPSS